MIAFRIDKTVLEDLVEKHQSGWLVRARERTKKLVQQGKYAEKTTIWSEVKNVFYHLQHGKCAYCERPLASQTYGAVEYDVEHYRPKSIYYWLAYDLGNYAVACPTCNRTLKSDNFPIAGTTGNASQNSTELDALELPLLLFPFRDDPSEFIDFFGATPQIKPQLGHEQNRARTTIEFFLLADELREELYMQRFTVIRELFTAYSNIKKQYSPETLESDQNLIQAFTSERAMHTACARAYLTLLEKDFVKAYKIREQAVKAVIDKSILPN